MKHPIEKINQQQAKMLEGLPPEERSWHERFFRFGNATYCYHQKAIGNPDSTATEPITITPTKEDFEDWLEVLPENIRKDMEAKGFEACKTALPFTRHVLERHDVGMEEWMREHLSEDDYKWWKSQK
ncbi:hypothetical protein [Cyclobacterium sp.]|uniref:hypothetical protein n=1 Tax=Cyclobacterium sp. TaxID=1966343 RepID=UPI0019B21802|nr:hypothetical protein [Cyclobacterium sp.]MBD3631294.1 hypothetical protein [Cyclobacterium sp.]